MSEKKKAKTLEELEADMIVVNDEYLIGFDAYGYSARRRGVTAALGYFGTIGNALDLIAKDMLKRKLRKDAKDISQVAEIVKQNYEDFKSLLKDKFPEYEVTKK